MGQRHAAPFRHQEHPPAVAITQCFTHADFADAIVVVQGIVHEVDAAIDRRANHAAAQLLLRMGQAEMPTPNADADTFSPVLPSTRYCSPAEPASMDSYPNLHESLWMHPAASCCPLQIVMNCPKHP